MSQTCYELNKLDPGLHREAGEFLDAIAREPGEDTPRLIFADWLDEHDAAPELAEFIRLDMDLYRNKSRQAGFTPAKLSRRDYLANRLIPPSCRDPKGKFPLTRRGTLHWKAGTRALWLVPRPKLDDRYWFTGSTVMVTQVGRADLFTALERLDTWPHVRGVGGLLLSHHTTYPYEPVETKLRHFFATAYIIPQLKNLSFQLTRKNVGSECVMLALARGFRPYQLTMLLDDTDNMAAVSEILKHPGLCELKAGLNPWPWGLSAKEHTFDALLRKSYIPVDIRRKMFLGMRYKDAVLRNFLHEDYANRRDAYDAAFEDAGNVATYLAQQKAYPSSMPPALPSLITEKSVFEKLYPTLKVD